MNNLVKTKNLNHYFVGLLEKRTSFIKISQLLEVVIVLYETEVMGNIRQSWLLVSRSWSIVKSNGRSNLIERY